MTNEELYQKAKDQVAGLAGYRKMSAIPDDPYTRYSIVQDDGTVWQPTKQELFEYAAIRAIQKAREEGEPWILVNEKMPKPFEDAGVSLLMLVYTERLTRTIAYYDFKKEGWFLGMDKLSGVTHWKEMPERPDTKKAP